MGLGAAWSASADTSDCATGFAQGLATTALGAKSQGEAIVLVAFNQYVDHACGALTQVALKIPPSGPLDPAFPDAMRGTTLAAAEGATHLGFDAARSEAEATFGFVRGGAGRGAPPRATPRRKG